jgi:hypothetical protein
MSGANGFTGLKTVPENADIFASQEFSPNSSDSMSVSLQVDTTLMTDKTSPNYTVMGSNISGNAADMVPVKDEFGVSGPLAVGVPWVKNSFPFKYIGIQYTANGNIGAGTFFMTYVQKVTRVNLV